MITRFTSLITGLAMALVLMCFVRCTGEDADTPVPVRTFNVSKGVLAIITQEQLNTFKNAGMPIYEGRNPPQTLDFTTNQVPRPMTFLAKQSCIYDNRNPANGGIRFDSLLHAIHLYSRRIDTSFVASVVYTSPHDNGAGLGQASGEGFNFSAFIKVEKGVVSGISYQALWVISGTILNADGFIIGIDNLYNGFLMLEKGEDPEDKVANPGTIRIFKDPDGFSGRLR